MQVQDILNRTKRTPVTIAPEKSIQDAMSLIDAQKIGSLVVVDDNAAPTGIITERDIFRLALQYNGDMLSMKIGDCMSTNLIVGVPGDDIDYIARIITQNRIRHIPIVEENGRLCGIVSIGDIVKAKLDDAEVHVRYLTEYITGRSSIS